MNITKCGKCERMLIDEEADGHVCRVMEHDFWVIDGIVYLSDGTTYYPHRLPTKLNNQKKQPENEQKLLLTSADVE